MNKEIILFGFYEDDFGFNFPGFFSNEKELLKLGKLTPLYTVRENKKEGISSWKGEVDRQGGSFSQEEIDNATAWR